MKEYKNESPAFSDAIQIVETTDPAHADNINSAPKQLLQNTLANKQSIEGIQENLDSINEEISLTKASVYDANERIDVMNDTLYLARSLATYNGKNLGEIYTPAAFKTKVQRGDFSGLELGDYFDITLTTDEKMRYVISGFNTYIGYTNGSYPLTANHVIMTPVDCMNKTAKMKETLDNTGGYAASLMPAYLETVLATFPAEWKSVIRTIRRSENNKGTSSFAARKLFLLSETEVYGHPIWSDVNDGGTRPLPLYQFSARYRMKCLGYGRTAAGNHPSDWWLASPTASDTTSFAHVGSTGPARYRYANEPYGVAPGFCI